MKIQILLPEPHKFQGLILESRKKRRTIRAGRRSGKTICSAMMAVKFFCQDRRVLYVAPVQDQTDSFWREVKRYLSPAFAPFGPVVKTESDATIELPGHVARIEARSGYNGDALRGGSADLIVLDEFQLAHESLWESVTAPMVLDRDGTVLFLYTPISLHSRTRSRADDPRHASKLFEFAQKHPDKWLALHFRSADNPHVSEVALEELAAEMSQLSYRNELLAEDVDEVPGALWTRKTLDETRVSSHPELRRVVVGLDPSGSSTTECGIVAAALGVDDHVYIVSDRSLLAPTPEAWARAAVELYEELHADKLSGERNYGGDLIQSTIRAIGGQVHYADVVATRGKIVRAEPIAAMFTNGKAHVVGTMAELEDELCGFCAGSTKSPNRLDAMVWACTDLALNYTGGLSDFLKDQAKKDEEKSAIQPSGVSKVIQPPAPVSVQDREAWTRDHFNKILGDWRR